jgi:predicted nucleic acid-binding protein
LILFVDTSALVKLYIAEPGSERMREAVAQGHPVAVSRLAFAEIHASFARRRREGLLPAPELDQLRLRFGDDWKEILQVPIGAEFLSLVPGLCDRNPLRGADALQLASALLLRQEGLEITFACSDHNLLNAAMSEGLTTFDPASGKP